MTTRQVTTTIRFAFAIVLFSLSTPTPAVTIDFDDLERNNAGINKHGQIYSEGGFTFSSNSKNGFASWGNKKKFYSGSTALFNNATGGITTLTENNGDLFSIQSIDLAELNNIPDVDVTFTGFLDSGDIISETFSFDDNNPDAVVAQTFFFDGFINLLALSWAQDPNYHSFDNLVLNEPNLLSLDSQSIVAPSAVPVPPAFWLFGTALIGLLGLNRHKTRAENKTQS